jgi:hypothetical protein
MSPVAGPSSLKKRKNEDEDYSFKDGKRRRKRVKKRWEFKTLLFTIIQICVESETDLVAGYEIFLNF